MHPLYAHLCACCVRGLTAAETGALTEAQLAELHGTGATVAATGFGAIMGGLLFGSGKAALVGAGAGYAALTLVRVNSEIAVARASRAR